LVETQKKVALITGAGSGIGRGFAHQMAQLNYVVIVTDLDESSAETVADEIREMGQTAVAYQFDITDADVAKQIVDAVIDTYGRIDVLFANAGALGPADFWDIQPSDWDVMTSVNIKGTAIISQLVAEHMKNQGSGRIVTTASYNAVRVAAHVIPYRVTKAAILMFTRCLAMVMAPYNVTVNAIAPGVTMTPMQEQYAEKTADERGITLDEYLDDRRLRIPMQELTTIDDLNALAKFIVSDDSRLITGQIIAVDGGVMASS